MNGPLRHTSLIALVASGCLCGCSLLAPQPDVSRFYTLSPVGKVEDAAPRSLTYGLGPIDLPPYLDRTELATRVSAAEVTYSPTDFWAESLRASVARVLQQDLSARLGGDRVILYPWPRAAGVRYQVTVAVLQFERTAGRETQLRARWSIRDLHTHTEVASKESMFAQRAASPTAAAAVDALSADLGEFSEEIASKLQNLPAAEAEGLSGQAGGEQHGPANGSPRSGTP